MTTLGEIADKEKKKSIRGRFERKNGNEIEAFSKEDLDPFKFSVSCFHPRLCKFEICLSVILSKKSCISTGLVNLIEDGLSFRVRI